VITGSLRLTEQLFAVAAFADRKRRMDAISGRRTSSPSRHVRSKSMAASALACMDLFCSK
jgi:hypothetical protein